MVRINKKLVELSYCSRRNADKLILSNRVKINDKIAILGDKVSDEDKIYVDNILIENKNSSKIIIAYNKPKSVICTESKIEKNKRIIDVIKELNFDTRLFTIGRLDKDTTGLLILTNDGDLAKRLTDTKNNFEKEYEVRVHKKITDEFIKKMINGVYLKDLNVTTKKCKIINVDKDKNKFNIIITQGLNRQIRRMCLELGYYVRYLKRIRIVNLKLGSLKIGEYREITEDEIFFNSKSY